MQYETPDLFLRDDLDFETQIFWKYALQWLDMSDYKPSEAVFTSTNVKKLMNSNYGLE